MQTVQLPFVDEHATTIAAPPEDVWASLLKTLDRGFSTAGASTYARIVGCEDRKASGPRPLAECSTIPGFRVVTAVPGRELVLEGRHRFSTYALTFRLDEVGPGRSVLRAETRAVFPGVAGRVYRLLVIGTGGHLVFTRRLLRGIQRGAERRGTGGI